MYINIYDTLYNIFFFVIYFIVQLYINSFPTRRSSDLGYYYDYDANNPQQQNEWKELWRKTEFTSVKHYDPNNIKRTRGDRKSTRLNSSHRCISYAVFCLKKKKKYYIKIL